jgi:hypothetical protein
MHIIRGYAGLIDHLTERLAALENRKAAALEYPALARPLASKVGQARLAAEIGALSSLIEDLKASIFVPDAADIERSPSNPLLDVLNRRGNLPDTDALGDGRCINPECPDRGKFYDQHALVTLEQIGGRPGAHGIDRRTQTIKRQTVTVQTIQTDEERSREHYLINDHSAGHHVDPRLDCPSCRITSNA